MSKKFISAIDLQRIIQAEVDDIELILQDTTKVRIGLPYLCEVDANGVNWNINKIGNESGYEVVIAKVIARYKQIFILSE